MKAIGSHTQNSSLSSAVDIDIPDQATRVMLSATTQNVRVTVDGSTDPTASKGLLIKAGENPVILPVPSAGTLKAIEASASAVLDYQFFQ